jgi:hypothetical protein
MLVMRFQTKRLDLNRSRLIPLARPDDRAKRVLAHRFRIAIRYSYFHRSTSMRAVTTSGRKFAKGVYSLIPFIDMY